MRKSVSLAMTLMLASVGAVGADEPRPVPLTRPEMKQFIEDMKSRKPRIPLPELTEDEKTKLGERGASYESRLRYHYMPAGEVRVGLNAGAGAAGGRRARAAGGAAGGLGREQDSN